MLIEFVLRGLKRCPLGERWRLVAFRDSCEDATYGATTQLAFKPMALPYVAISETSRSVHSAWGATCLATLIGELKVDRRMPRRGDIGTLRSHACY